MEDFLNGRLDGTDVTKCGLWKDLREFQTLALPFTSYLVTLDTLFQNLPFPPGESSF